MVLFFYYFLADVILELLLVSNIVPSTSSINKVKYLAQLILITIEVCSSNTRRDYMRHVLSINDEWICEFSMGRRWDKCFCLGKKKYSS